MRKIKLFILIMEHAFPEISDFIEMLWITENKPMYWKSQVLDFFKLNRDSKIGCRTLGYEPGPGVKIHTCRGSVQNRKIFQF